MDNIIDFDNYSDREATIKEKQHGAKLIKLLYDQKFDKEKPLELIAKIVIELGIALSAVIVSTDMINMPLDENKVLSFLSKHTKRTVKEMRGNYARP